MTKNQFRRTEPSTKTLQTWRKGLSMHKGVASLNVVGRIKSKTHRMYRCATTDERVAIVYDHLVHGLCLSSLSNKY